MLAKLNLSMFACAGINIYGSPLGRERGMPEQYSHETVVDGGFYKVY
jgi:hypothetical protein